MPTLIACLSSGKGTWTEVNKIINSQPWSKVFLIVDHFGKDNYKVSQSNIELIVVNFFNDIPLITEQIVSSLQGKISDFEVALNFVSGSGKEHMALMEAMLELGLNFRLITVNNNQVETLGLKVG